MWSKAKVQQERAEQDFKDGEYNPPTSQNLGARVDPRRKWYDERWEYLREDKDTREDKQEQGVRDED